MSAVDDAAEPIGESKFNALPKRVQEALGDLAETPDNFPSRPGCSNVARYSTTAFRRSRARWAGKS